MSISLAITMLAALPSWVIANDCPALYRRYSTTHTYCLGPNPTCELLDNTITPAQIEEILRSHNKQRSHIAVGEETTGNLPPAADMLQMEWDEELAKVAQKHANRCKMEHDCNECRQTVDFSAGQNLFQSMTSASVKPKADWQTAVQRWYNEVENFDAELIKPYDFNKIRGTIGHFTQVIWSKSWKIGCGYAAYKYGSGVAQLYTCNYGPAGNMYMGAVYEPGRTCSSCPANTCCGYACSRSPNYPGLCQVPEGGRPENPQPAGNYLYYCGFTDQEECRIALSQQVKPWNITRTLTGNYIGIVLEGGESSKFVVETTFKALPEACLSFSFRKGPDVAGQVSNNNAQVHVFLPSANYDSTVQLGTDSTGFRTFGFTFAFNMEFKVGISFEVPTGAPPQYLEIKDISIKSGSC